jgi:hypothetical protein
MNPVWAIAAPIKIGFAHAAFALVAEVMETPAKASAPTTAPTSIFLEIFTQIPLFRL